MSRVPSEIELEAIRDFILLPIMLTIVKNNRQEIEASSESLKQLYVAAADALLNRIHYDLVQVRKSLKESNIKVWEVDRTDYAIRYNYVCRGYEDQFAMMRDLVRAEIGVRLGEYVAKVIKDVHI